MCHPADMPEDREMDDGRWREPKKPRDWFACDICGSREGVRIIEQRVKWGRRCRRPRIIKKPSDRDGNDTHPRPG